MYNSILVRFTDVGKFKILAVAEVGFDNLYVYLVSSHVLQCFSFNRDCQLLIMCYVHISFGNLGYF
jgi:hypothetical protein